MYGLLVFVAAIFQSNSMLVLITLLFIKVLPVIVYKSTNCKMEEK